MQELIPLIAQHGVLLVFGAVLIEQLGAPLPAVPVMIVAGALAATGDLSLAAVFAAAVAASVAADTVWYVAGRRTGRGILATLCRISLSPDSCVRQTENVFARWGAGCLVFAKFVPGLSRERGQARGTGWFVSTNVAPAASLTPVPKDELGASA